MGTHALCLTWLLPWHWGLRNATLLSGTAPPAHWIRVRGSGFRQKDWLQTTLDNRLWEAAQSVRIHKQHHPGIGTGSSSRSSILSL